MQKTQSELVEDILTAEIEAIRAIPASNPYEKVVDALHDAVEAHGTVIVSGVGKAGDIGRKIVSTFNSVGVRSIALSALDAAHGDLGVIHKNSVLLVISNSGKTRELIELVEIARKLHPKIKVIALTGNAASPIGSLANFVLATGSPKEIDRFGLVPTTSSVAMLVIGDILTVMSMEKRDFTAKEYQLHHHGGYIGTQAKKLSDKE